MTSENRKRSIIPAARLAQLKERGAAYEVRCGISGCPCDNPGAYCGRGFFSLFIQAVYGIEFARRIEIPYYINFGSCIYPYSKPDHPADPNFWNYYFRQPLKDADGIHHSVINDFIEIYPLRIWNRSFIRQIHDSVVKHLQFTDEVTAVLEDVAANFKTGPVLGVHIRRTDHHEEIPAVKIESYMSEVERKLVKGERLFLATDDKHVLDIFAKKYGDMLLVNNVLRSSGKVSTHSNPEFIDKFRLGLDALVDCYSLSLCRQVILTQSNLSYAALLFNPELKFRLMERPRTSIRRLKTLLAYNLDRWGIRKW